MADEETLSRVANIVDGHEWSRFGGSLGEQVAAKLDEAGLLVGDSALRARMIGLADQWDRVVRAIGLHSTYTGAEAMSDCAVALRAITSPTVDATPEPTPANPARCRVCGGIGGEHDGAAHDARVADMPTPAAEAREAALRARIKSLADEWDATSNPILRSAAGRLRKVARSAALTSPAEDTTPEPTPAEGTAAWRLRVSEGRPHHGLGPATDLSGNVQHLVSPLVGLLRLLDADAETPDADTVKYMIDRLSFVLELAREPAPAAEPQAEGGA